MVEQRPFKALVVGSSPTQPKLLICLENRSNKGSTSDLVFENLYTDCIAKTDKAEGFGEKSGAVPLWGGT
jgi:hypothetical protein